MSQAGSSNAHQQRRHDQRRRARSLKPAKFHYSKIKIDPDRARQFLKGHKHGQICVGPSSCQSIALANLWARIFLRQSGATRIQVPLGISEQQLENIQTWFALNINCGTPQVGQTFCSLVVQTLDQGILVAIGPNQQNFVHISELSHQHIKEVEDVVTVGDLITVKTMSICPTKGHMRFTARI